MGAMSFLPDLGLSPERREVHGIFIPEMALDIKAEAARLRKIMDKHDCVNLFISEGACVSDIVLHRLKAAVKKCRVMRSVTSVWTR